MRFEYKTRGTCSSKILFDVDDGIVHNLEYIGGCNGNLQGMSRLVEGMNIDDVIARVQGIHCGMALRILHKVMNIFTPSSYR